MRAEQPALAAAAAAAEQAAPLRDPSMPVQGGAEPAEADSANQQQPPDMANSASSKMSNALAAAPAAGSQQGSAEFQEGAHRGTQGAVMACSEPCSGLPAASRGGAPSAASAADATQGGVLVAQGSGEAAADDAPTTSASKVSYWSKPATHLVFSILSSLHCSAEQHVWQLGWLCNPGQTAMHSHLLQCSSSLRAATSAVVQCLTHASH